MQKTSMQKTATQRSLRIDHCA